MKKLFIFLAGVGVGLGVSMIFLRKMVKKELENIRIEGDLGENQGLTAGLEGGNGENGADLPFTFGGDASEKAKKAVVQGVQGPVSPVVSEHVSYEKMYVPSENETGSVDENGNYEPAGETENDGGIHEIDMDEYMHNHNYVNETLLYFETEELVTTDTGEQLTGYPLLIGLNWKKNFGKYVPNTAFVRNESLHKDYEITAMGGLYEEEFPDAED